MASGERIVARPGPALKGAGTKRRPMGRLVGLSAGLPEAAGLAAAKVMGPLSQVLAPMPGSIILDGDELSASDYATVPASFEGLAGPFAAIWRDAAGALCLARDAIGGRTLFYARAGEGWVAASRIDAILASGLVPVAVNPVAVARYLCYAYVPGRETLAAGVFEVLPGEVVKLDGPTARISRWWDMPAEPAQPEDEAVLQTRLRACLDATVARMWPDAGPAGASLSGGIDSSLVAAIAAQSGPVHTYSITFGAGHRDELAFSAMVADHIGSTHHVLELPPDAIAAHLDDAVGLLAEPIGDPLTVPNALLFREASAHVDVVFNGEGGDPSFGGPKNLPMVLASLYGPGVVAPTGGDLARERDYLRAHQRCFDDLGAMLEPAVVGAIAGDRLAHELTPYVTDPRYPSLVNKLMAINVAFKGAHHILPKVDALGAPFGLLPRAPLFDKAVVELAFAIPPKLKQRGATEKYLLKLAVADLLPEAILARPKSGMLVPVESWFDRPNGPLYALARERLLDGLAPRGLVRRVYLEDLLAGRLGGPRPRRGIKIWQLITLEAWLRLVLDSAKKA